MIAANGTSGISGRQRSPVRLSRRIGCTHRLAAIVTALGAASREGFGRLATVPCDAPFLPQDLIARLSAAIGGAPGIVVRSHGRLHPTFGLWPTASLPSLSELFASGERRLGTVCRQMRVLELDADAAGWPARAFHNINTEADLAEAAGYL